MRTHLPVALMIAICAVVAGAATRIDVTQGIKKLAAGDGITITEVSSEKGTIAAGDTITVKGTYTLASQQNAHLFFSVTQNTKEAPAITVEQGKGFTHKTIQAGTGEYEMTINIPYEGWTHLGFYDSETGKSFGELYFGTKEQMDKIAHWDLDKWFTQKSGNENIVPATNNWNYWQIFNEWEALMEGKNGMPKDEAKAGQFLTQLIKGVYLVKFNPTDGFNPQTPGELLQAFSKTSSLKSAKDRLGGSGFFRTKRENNKLMASFLTEQPDQMKQDIKKNPQLVFISMEEITPDKFVSHVKSAQESLRNAPVAGVQNKTKIGSKVIPSTLDPAYAAKREQAFTEWNKPPRTDEIFKEQSKSHIPIYNEHRKDQSNRDIYIQNSGARYWVLGGLTDQSLLKVHQDKLTIGDELASVSYYENEKGQKVYWALWCSGTHANWVKEKMREYGITPARIDYTFADKLQSFSDTLNPYSGILALASLGISLIALCLLVVLFIKSVLTRSSDKPREA